jgi:hypothetical protein
MGDLESLGKLPRERRRRRSRGVVRILEISREKGRRGKLPLPLEHRVPKSNRFSKC